MRKKIFTFLLALAASMGLSWAVPTEFANCYDCWRNPAYPTNSGQSRLYNIGNPGVGNGNPSGPWKLEFVEYYNSSSTEYSSSIVGSYAANEYEKSPEQMEVYRLYQWQNGAYQPVAYGVLYAYANESNTVEHAAFFEANGYYGCYLTGNTHSGDDDFYIEFDEDAKTGFVDLHTAPASAENVDITPYADPQDASVYYSTFYDSNFKYELPTGVEAYVADLSGANLLLTKIAEAGEVIPADNAVILKSTENSFTLTQSDAAAVTFTATNDLQGSDTQIATPANCYVLAGTDGVVGFYHYTAANLNAHKAYVVYSGSNQAPRRMPFIFDQATGVENVQGDNVQSTKVIENGQLIIIRNGVRYNAAGQNVK